MKIVSKADGSKVLKISRNDLAKIKAVNIDMFSEGVDRTRELENIIALEVLKHAKSTGQSSLTIQQVWQVIGPEIKALARKSSNIGKILMNSNPKPPETPSV